MAKKKPSNKKPSKSKPSQSALPQVRGYWRETSRPLVSLAFVAPLLVAYEGGLLVLGPHAMRNGADVWLRRLLELIGFSQYFLLPVLICGLLLSWHHVRRECWRVSGKTLYGMLFESLGFGALLMVAAHLQYAAMTAVSIDSTATAVRHIVSYLGAGIYEELLFRLMLLPAMAFCVHKFGASQRTSLVSAVVLSSLLFAAAHCQIDVVVGPIHLATSVGEAFDWMTFAFRSTAGGFFSLLFLYRGFGIAVGAHALYDILIVCL